MKKYIFISILFILILIGTGCKTNAYTNREIPKKYVALTFDDGPNENTTPLLLDILEAENVHATFFMIGQNAQQFSGIVKRIYDEGDMIGNHTWDHRALRGLSSGDIINEIQKTQDIIYKITGYTPILFRPPYGAQNKMILRISHLASVQRSLDSNDRKLPSSEILVKHIMDRVHPGSIILMHDTLTGTVQALPQIIDSLEKSGYTLVTVGKLLGGYKYIHPGRIYRRQRTISHIMQ